MDSGEPGEDTEQFPPKQTHLRWEACDAVLGPNP